MSDKANLYRKYADLIDMMESNGLPSDDAYRYVGFRGIKHIEAPVFESPIENYRFPVAVVDNTPVYTGQVVYLKDGDTVILGGNHNKEWVTLSCGAKIEMCNLTLTKPAFLIGDVEVPPPTDSGSPLHIPELRWENEEDMIKAKAAILGLFGR